VIALSIRQPWAWLILNAGKEIENRDWPTRFRGRFLIHASKGMTLDEYDNAVDTAILAGRKRPFKPGTILPAPKDLEKGGIVGSAELVDCVRHDDSPWFFGTFGFLLRDPRPMPFIPYKGQLGFFNVPDEIIASVPSTAKESK
jgi:hypothetical protein